MFVNQISHELPNDHPIKGEYIWGCNGIFTGIYSAASIGDMILTKVELSSNPNRIYSYCSFIKTKFHAEQNFWPTGIWPLCFTTTRPVQVAVTFESMRSIGFEPRGAPGPTLLDRDGSAKFRSYQRSQLRKDPPGRVFWNRRDNLWRLVCDSQANVRDGVAEVIADEEDGV
jgi:hypothetical protein